MLRAQPGDPLFLFNGEGGEYRAEVSNLERKRVRVQIQSWVDINRESELAVHLGLGILKRDAMLSALQRATELGVTTITPLQLEFVNVSVKQQESAARKWQQIVQSAAEQCGRTRLPDLVPISPLHTFLKTGAEVKIAAHPDAAESMNLMEEPPQSVAVLLGPEGGISAGEITQATSAGFHAMKFGPRILRAETAPAAVIAVLQSRWGDINLRSKHF